MKQLIIDNGGMPFTGDDLVYLQNGLLEGINAAIIPFLKDGKAILSGVEYDGANLSAGWIVIDNEILFYEGETIADISNYELSVSEVYDPAGTDVFADGVSRDTYQYRKAVLTISGAASGGIISSNDFDKYRITGINDKTVITLSDPAYEAKFIQVGDVVSYSMRILSKSSGTLAISVPEISPPEASNLDNMLYFPAQSGTGYATFFADANNNLGVIVNGDVIDEAITGYINGSYVI